MEIIKWTVGGIVGAAVGAGIWVAVGHFTGYEVGWIAIGVGFLAGLGVAFLADGEEGWGPGIVATLCAILGVAAGKYFVFKLFLSQAREKVGEEFAEVVIRNVSFFDTLGGWDLLWFGLAAVTAFKVGSGMVGDD